MDNKLRDKLVELFAVTSLEFEDAVVLANYLIQNGVTIPVCCKDCIHYDNSEGIQWCKLNSKFYPGGFDWNSFPEDGFCSYGERRTNAQE